jgi:hypothetical protein
MRGYPHMHRRKRVGAAVVAAVAAVAVAFGTPALAQEGDLDCGDPGTSPNMTVGAEDPNGLDADNDGIGCEEPADFGDGGTAPAGDDGGTVEPATPVEEEPTFTG